MTNKLKEEYYKSKEAMEKTRKNVEESSTSLDQELKKEYGEITKNFEEAASISEIKGPSSLKNGHKIGHNNRNKQSI